MSKDHRPTESTFSKKNDNILWIVRIRTQNRNQKVQGVLLLLSQLKEQFFRVPTSRREVLGRPKAAIQKICCFQFLIYYRCDQNIDEILDLLKGGLPAALFKPRTVKGTASQATPPGRCLAFTRLL